ncbi:hypothetical protein L1856_04595 [Streptomyces sp. Tue 6430]|nr:hypothetical protein [Streptomyces sp. Tue 6430]
MEHTDDETLALIAIGEEPSPPAAEHLLACARCARELRALRHVVASARASSLDEHDLLQPPAGLWDSIAAELGIAVRHDRDTEAPPSPARPSRAAEEERTAEEGSLAEEGNATREKSVTSTATSRPSAWAAARERLRGPGRFAVALAACAALLGAAAGARSPGG